MLKTKKTKKMLEIEAKADKGIRELLVDLYVKKNLTYWQMTHFIKEEFDIDITIGGLSRWFLKLDIETRDWRLPK